MTTPTNIGYISLNLSFYLYLIHYTPQLLHNVWYKKTRHISLLMHHALIMGYLADLLYGFGRHMPWQYRSVTIVGLSCLLIQHIQIGLYQRPKHFSLKKYAACSVLIISLIVAAIVCIVLHQNIHPQWFITAGLLSQCSWLIHSAPQIYKNYRIKTASGLSVYYLGLTLFLGSCDLISAYALHWDYPSKIGPWISITMAALLIWQYQRFDYRQNRLPS